MSQPSRSRKRVRKSNSTRTIAMVAGAVVLLLAVAAIGYSLLGTSDTALASQVESTDWNSLGKDHVTTAVEYASNPPVGGNHNAAPANWGSYPSQASAPADEHLVHNMEHGGVIIWFDPAAFTGDQYSELFTFYQELTKINYRTLLVARSGMATPLAMTAWGQLLRLQAIDKPLMEEFYNTYILRGPECGATGCPR